MFKALLDRLLNRKQPTSDAPTIRQRPTVATAASNASSPASPASAGSSAPAPPATPRAPRLPGPPPVGIGARRPLVAPGGALAGFEFHAGAAGRTRLRRLEDEVTTRACTANVLGAMRLCLGQDLLALAEVPATWLARAADDLFAAGMHLVLCPDALFDDAAALARLVTRLRGAGCRVGWRIQPSGGLVAHPVSVRPDFVLVDAPEPNDLDSWQRALVEVSTRLPGVDQVMLDLPDIDTLETLLRPPVILGACGLDGAIRRTGAVALSPQVVPLLRLLARLTRDEDNALLTADIKSDAALSLRLLQYLNSAGATPGRPLDSIDQAVMVLGRDALYQWSAQMIVRLGPARESSAALQAMALARARFFEFLARGAKAAQPGQLYLFGLVSMLPRLLGCSLESAVDSLDLPEAAVAALQQGRGPWVGYLAVAQALDRHDMVATEALSAPFGGVDAVLAASARAWLPRLST